MNSNIRYDSLTGLRFILALMVLVCHGWIRTSLAPSNYWFSKAVTEMGHCGVSGFFVLSGFILATVYRDKKNSVKDFYLNRFARIYPMYIVGILFSLPIDWYSEKMSNENKTEALIASITLLQSWFPFSNGRFNGPGWTLSVEAFFYAAFPILLVILRRNKSLFYLNSALVIFITCLFWNSNYFYFSHQFPLMRMWEFMLGMALATISCNILYKFTEIIPLSIVLICPFVVGLNPLKSYAFFNWFMMAIFSAISILILAHRDRSKIGKSILRIKWLVLGGEISYSIYILHAGIQRYGNVLFDYITKSHLANTSILFKIIYIFITTISSIILSFFSWKIIELPARNWIRQKWQLYFENNSSKMRNKI